MQFRPDSHEKALINDVMKLKYKYGSEKLMLRTMTNDRNTKDIK